MNQKHHHKNTPTVESKVERFTMHGVTIQDEYKWLRDENWPEISNPEILSYVKAENEYSKAFIDQNSDLIEKIFKEIKSKISIKDFSVPYRDGEYMYYSYILENNQYWNHARRKVNHDTEKDLIKKISQELEQELVSKDVFLNENDLAKDSKFFSLQTYEVSPSQEMVAYSVDYKGDQRYNIIVQEIDSGKIIDTQVTNTMGNVVWHENSKGFFYIPANEFWRSEKVLYHEIVSKSQDIEIFHEKDYTFSVEIQKSSSQDFLFITSSSYTETEVKFLDLRKSHINPEECKFVFKRKPGHMFSVTHNGNYFYILTNDLGDNFRLVKTPIDDLSKSEELLSHNASISLTEVDIYQDHLVLESRINGLPNLSVYKINPEDGTIKFAEDIKFNEPSYDVRVLFTPFKSNAFRYKYSSLKNPGMVYGYDFTTSETTKLKEVKLNGFNPDDYEVKYEYVSVPPVYHGEDVNGKDNTYLKNDVKVPVTIIYKKSSDHGPKPLWLYGYGSYGIPMPTHFRPSIFPLLDRGVVFAIAHIRGGGEFGRMWYEAGKMLHKKNTFEDFIKVAEYLKNEGYASSIAISGGSAGGMLIGYCINNRPDLYQAAVTQVPFVDVLNTMLDDTLPLTPLEFNEWGNPITNKETFDYIRSYSPYDNIKPQKYPHLYISSGLYDQRVTYWEPLKFVAKLRNIMKDQMLFLKMNMNAGHSGASGRFDYIYEIAEEDVFFLTAFDKHK